MRVSTQMYPQSLLNQLNKLTGQQQTLQNQVSTGLRVQEASDDPAAARKMIQWQTDMSGLNQFRKNIAAQQDLAKMNHGLVQSLNNISSRVHELAIKSDDTQNPETLTFYAEEVNSLIERASELVNTRFHGKYLLAGTAEDAPAFTFERDEDGRIIGAIYEGNGNIRSVESSPGNQVSAQWIGANDGTSEEPGLIQDTDLDFDVFRDLIAFRDHLLSGDTNLIREEDIDRLQQVEDHFLHFMHRSGAAQTRLEASLGSLNDQELALTGMISREGEVDLAETIVRLNEVQYAYQAALQSGAKIMNSSLMNYLR